MKGRHSTAPSATSAVAASAMEQWRTPDFDFYVAVDWSGAKGSRHRGVAIAVAEPVGAPAIVPPPAIRGWARSEVAEWLRALPGRVLAGFDFSFAPPFAERGCYLPGADAPDTGPAFWAWVDAQCTDADLGAASFLERTHRPHFYFGARDGRKADYMHWRACETAFNATGGHKSSTVFDAIGPSQVAKASFAGMRLLNQLHGTIAIWPFDQAGPRTIVEIYARAMIRHAGLPGRKIRDDNMLATALARLECPPPATAPRDDNESDALITAAALRYLSARPGLWHPAGLTDEIARTEGWTFGIG